MKCGVERFLVPFCPLCQRQSNFSRQKFMFREEMNCKGNDVQDIAIYSSTSSVNMLFTLFSFPNLLSFTWNNPFSLWALPFSACSLSELQFHWHFCWNMKNWVSGIPSRGFTWSRNFNIHTNAKTFFYSSFPSFMG